MLDYQAQNRLIIHEAVTPAVMRSMVLGMVRKAEEGDSRAFAALQPWIVGAEPKEVTVGGGFRVEVVYVDERPGDAVSDDE